MNTMSRHALKGSALATTVLAGLLLAACTGPQHSSPQQVEATYPSVTYTYHNDDELIQAGQRAATHCTQYQSIAQTQSFGKENDGTRTVVFNCIPTNAPTAPRPEFSPNMSYTYRSDQELVDAARNAQIYCLNNGSQQAISNVATNSDGSKTVTFHCNPR